jgi:hypothetical protein
MTRMPRRWCIDCNALFDANLTRTFRCPPCQAAADAVRRARNRAYDKTRDRGTTTERGYGAAYQRARRQLLATAIACHWCGLEFTAASPATADHDPPLARGGTERQMVASCGPCNSRRGGQLRRR